MLLLFAILIQEVILCLFQVVSIVFVVRILSELL